jgi:hypothetical protein
MRKLALLFTGIMARRRLLLAAGCPTATTTTAGCVMAYMYGTGVDKQVDG